MFDLIANGHRRTPHGDTVPIMVSAGLHSVAAIVLIVVPLLYMSDSIPQVPTMMAFVVAAPAPPPPPPPPPPRVKTQTLTPQATTPTHAPAIELVAPIQAPVALAENLSAEGAREFGVPGGVEGGVPGGVIGGLAANVPPPAPAPPPDPPDSRGPVRIGGQIRPPTLVARVEPVYPEFAVRGHVEGVVIIEAIVDREGCVEDARVLRPIPLLNKAALDAVRQWRYAPLLINGEPVRFILTVTVAFHITEKT